MPVNNLAGDRIKNPVEQKLKKKAYRAGKRNVVIAGFIACDYVLKLNYKKGSC